MRISIRSLFLGGCQDIASQVGIFYHEKSKTTTWNKLQLRKQMSIILNATISFHVEKKMKGKRQVNSIWRRVIGRADGRGWLGKKARRSRRLMNHNQNNSSPDRVGEVSQRSYSYPHTIWLKVLCPWWRLALVCHLWNCGFLSPTLENCK